MFNIFVDNRRWNDDIAKIMKLLKVKVPGHDQMLNYDGCMIHENVLHIYIREFMSFSLVSA